MEFIIKFQRIFNLRLDKNYDFPIGYLTSDTVHVRSKFNYIISNVEKRVEKLRSVRIFYLKKR